MLQIFDSFEFSLRGGEERVSFDPFDFSLFLRQVDDEDHNLLFHSVKSGNRQAFNIALEKSQLDWQNDKGNGNKGMDTSCQILPFISTVNFVLFELYHVFRNLRVILGGKGEEVQLHRGIA